MMRRSRHRRYRTRRVVASAVLVVFGIVALGGMATLSSRALLQSDREDQVSSVTEPDAAGAPDLVAQADTAQNNDEKPKKEEKNNEGDKKKDDGEPAPPDDTMYLTVPKLGVYDHVVRNSNDQWALDQGAAKLPQTGFPWDGGDTNTYISGHRIGYAGNESFYQFYNLPSLVAGDMIYLTDSAGRKYEYRVTEKMEVNEYDTWVTGPVKGQDIVSLQTCLNPPDWSERLVVRAERIS